MTWYVIAVTVMCNVILISNTKSKNKKITKKKKEIRNKMKIKSIIFNSDNKIVIFLVDFQDKAL